MNAISEFESANEAWLFATATLVAVLLAVREILTTHPNSEVKDMQRIFLLGFPKRDKPSKAALKLFLGRPKLIALAPLVLAFLHYLPMLLLLVYFGHFQMLAILATIIFYIRVTISLGNVDLGIDVHQLFGLSILQSANKLLPAEIRREYFQKWIESKNKTRKELAYLGIELLPDSSHAKAVAHLRAKGWTTSQLARLQANRPTEITLPDTLPAEQLALFANVPHQTLAPWTQEDAAKFSFQWTNILKMLHRLAPLLRNEDEISCLKCLCKPVKKTVGRLQWPICPNCNSQYFLAGPISSLVAHFSPDFHAAYQNGQLHFSIHTNGWHPTARPNVLCIDADLNENVNMELASYLEFCENNQIETEKQLAVLNENAQDLDENLVHFLEERGIAVQAEMRQIH